MAQYQNFENVVLIRFGVWRRQGVDDSILHSNNDTTTSKNAKEPKGGSKSKGDHCLAVRANNNDNGCCNFDHLCLSLSLSLS
eukprot:CAMPEP_0168782694 /NCGR_PEP_ID=MMETSP0725-20121227/9298_1 /TAXON_ID=265536 /ORGANISM="Amphiprora sp., Strain CCMP467" /LENGTH=81 /DNA_ID=CAMNT_0008832639 /DNA_START=148 /DNA_END=389 /DNA_ORIENTATION=+